jgi:hypothetical protein
MDFDDTVLALTIKIRRTQLSTQIETQTKVHTGPQKQPELFWE